LSANREYLEPEASRIRPGAGSSPPHRVTLSRLNLARATSSVRRPLKWYEEGLWHLLSFGPGIDQGKSGGLSKSD
jgi:hypothetical protein